MNRHTKRLNELQTIAMGVQDFPYHRHAAAIYIGNRLVSVGMNQRKTHPLQAKFGKNSDAIFLHAEISAIVNALKVVSPDELQNATLYVAKYSPSGKTMSKPCKGCQRAIGYFGFKDVHWTEDLTGTK